MPSFRWPLASDPMANASRLTTRQGSQQSAKLATSVSVETMSLLTLLVQGKRSSRVDSIISHCQGTKSVCNNVHTPEGNPSHSPCPSLSVVANVTSVSAPFPVKKSCLRPSRSTVLQSTSLCVCLCVKFYIQAQPRSNINIQLAAFC